MPDVDADPRYLACFATTRSEIVVPIFDGGEVIGEIDVDGSDLDAFDDTDAGSSRRSRRSSRPCDPARNRPRRASVRWLPRKPVLRARLRPARDRDLSVRLRPRRQPSGCGGPDRAGLRARCRAARHEPRPRPDRRLALPRRPQRHRRLRRAFYRLPLVGTDHVAPGWEPAEPPMARPTPTSGRPRASRRCCGASPITIAACSSSASSSA